MTAKLIFQIMLCSANNFNNFYDKFKQLSIRVKMAIGGYWYPPLSTDTEGGKG